MGPVPESCRRSFIRGLTTWIMEDYQRICDRRIHTLMLSTLLGRTLLSISFLLTGVLCEGGVLGLVTEVREDSVLCHGFNPMLIFLRVLSLLLKSNVKNVMISINTEIPLIHKKILSIEPEGKIYGQNLSDHKYGPEL